MVLLVVTFIQTAVGVFTTWKKAEAQVMRFPRAKFKKFSTEAEAWQFVRTNCGARTVSSGNNQSSTRAEAATSLQLQPPPGQIARTIEVYADGSCKNNGRANAKGGIGICA